MTAHGNESWMNQGVCYSIHPISGSCSPQRSREHPEPSMQAPFAMLCWRWKNCVVDPLRSLLSNTVHSQGRALGGVVRIVSMRGCPSTAQICGSQPRSLDGQCKRHAPRQGVVKIVSIWACLYTPSRGKKWECKVAGASWPWRHEE